jgi:hypothetical protein
MDQSNPRHQQLFQLVAYRSASEEQVAKMQRIRYYAVETMIAIDEECPPGADRTAAVRQLLDALMTANRSITHNGASYR